MAAVLSIDVVSDVVCPWCFIGKRRLDGALAMWREAHPDVAVTLRWHPFQLNPDMPPEGMDRQTYLLEKFGPRAESVHERMAQVGRELGIDFAFARIARQPNTLLAHALLEACEDDALQARLKDALLAAYFVEGRDVGDATVLRALALQVGLPAAQVDLALTDAALHEQVRAIDASARRMGISGVPFFIFNRRVAVSGAQPSDELLAAMQQAMTAPPASA